MNLIAKPRHISLLLALVMIFSLLIPGVPAASAAGESSTGTVLRSAGGQDLPINWVNVNVDASPQKADYVALFTSGASVTNTTYSDKIYVKRTNAALVVDSNDQVIRKIGPIDGDLQNWEPNQYVDIPEGGYILLANDNGWNSKNFRKPLITNHELNSTVSLYRDGVKVSAEDFIRPALIIGTASGTKVETASFAIEGQIVHYAADRGLSLTVGGAEVPVLPDGSFSAVVMLAEGLNSIEVKLMKDQAQLEVKTVTVTYVDPSRPLIQVEAAPEDITIEVQGPMAPIDYIDTDVTGISNVIALFTREFSDTIAVPQYNVAVQVDKFNKVLKVVNPAVGGGLPSWVGDPALAIPEGGYVLMAQDDKYDQYNIKRFLATKFKVGDTIKLRRNGEVISVNDLMTGNGPIAKLSLSHFPMYTVTRGTETIIGQITNATDYSDLTLTINGETAVIGADGAFRHPLSLAAGVNYVEAVVSRDGEVNDSKQLVIYSRPEFASEKKVILWVDQAANARKFQTSQHVRDFLQAAKDTGVTTIALDVLGVEGYATYKKSDLTHRPYASEITAPGKAGVNPDLDLLELFSQYSRELGMDLHVAFNIFAEGSIASNEYALLNDHLDWEEQVLQTDNQIKRLRESNRQGLVAFVNPHNDEVREFQLKTMEEVIKNYDIDGVILDRGRFDNEGADFSDLTRGKFEQYLAERGKTLNKWPDDVFKYVNGSRVNGPLIQDWWTFRSHAIKSFTADTRALADRYTDIKDQPIQVSAYVGSWFESYYLNGVHWGSTEFRYDERLGMPDEYVYTDDYYETGYIGHLDFLMIGAYQTTRQEIEKYITLGNIVTNTEKPMYAGIAMNNVQDPELQRLVFQAGLETTHGLMLFDASQVNWDVAAAALRDEPYVRDFQIGVSMPLEPDQFMEANFHNVSLVEGNINVMTDSFGYSTGTGRYAVEAVIDGNGAVTRVVNKNNAVNWSWGVPEDANSVIPADGFAISALDPSGTRTRRQLVANNYSVGDQVRASKLRGLLAHEGQTVNTSSAVIQGYAEVLGPGTAEVKVNGVTAALASNGRFTAEIPLQVGDNTVTVEVSVDGYLTNRKSFAMKRELSSTGGSGVYIPAAPKLLNTETTTAPDGRKQLNARFDAAELTRELERVLGSSQAPASGKPVVTLAVPGDAPVASIHLPADSLRKAAEQAADGLIELVTQQGRIVLPLAALAKSLGDSSQAAEIVVEIAAMSDADRDAWAGSADSDADAEWIGAPVRFAVTVIGKDDAVTVLSTSGSDTAKAVEGVYIERSFTLPAAVDPLTSTVVRIDPATGEYRFVPSRFIEGENGMTIAYVYDAATDGTYAILSDPESFADMAEHWSQAVVNMLASKQLVQGVAADVFAPDQSLSRAQFAALLVRALGLTATVNAASAGGPGFSDIAASDWFAAEAAAAVQAGLIEGFEDGTFRPDDLVTREQMSVMLQRALSVADVALAGGGRATAAFADNGDISPWAAEAVAAAAAAGLLEGRDGGRFEPGAPATRAEGAAVLARLLRAASWLN